ncbi:hypothetical protein LAZ67_6002725 [Cordylochernes scorpioides]|uniref:Mariner Mos1 transposase n=1 Tax=Cordylochernes scorpioides TaxID=51811 RepID=A0ABY6KLD7_9ARAC|nr:hypothetical protein LAZ67_6002725 [Cordylochernes scorpioides]
MSKSRIKTMIIVFFDIRGIVHCDFVPQGQTVNSAFYLGVLKRLKRRIASVRTDIKGTVKLHHDNATSHTAFIITNFLARSNTPVIPHPPYSPYLAPSILLGLTHLKSTYMARFPDSTSAWNFLVNCELDSPASNSLDDSAELMIQALPGTGLPMLWTPSRRVRGGESKASISEETNKIGQSLKADPPSTSLPN